MEMNQKECGIVCKENSTEQIEKVTEEEWKLLKQKIMVQSMLIMLIIMLV